MQQDNNIHWDYAEVTCPNCSAQVSYRDTTLSTHFGCPSCHAFFKKEGDVCTVVENLASTYEPQLLLECGDVGKIEDKEFVVVAYLRKYDEVNNLSWDEYILIDVDKETYYTLANVNSDWYFVFEAEHQRFLIERPSIYSEERIIRQEQPFRVYSFDTGYKYNILHALGEFDYNILEDRYNLYAEEFHAHPHMMLSETKDGETVWYRGVHFDEYEVKAGFSEEVKKRFPKTFLERYNEKWVPIRNVGLFFFLLALITHFIFNYTEGDNLYKDQFVHEQANSWDDNADIFNGGTIDVDGPTAITIFVNTTISNQWVEIAGTLTDVATGKTYTFSKELEQYHGYEGGENWSEGDNAGEIILSSVPSGTYKLNIFPYSATGQTTVIDIKVKDKTTLTSNLVLLLLLILTYPAYMLLWKYSIESSGNSDY